MKITYINNDDIVGARFNGYNLMQSLNATKVAKAQMLVYDKASRNENVISFADKVGTRDIYRKFEEKHSLHGIIYPYGRKIMGMEEFTDADIIHYHLIHNYILSLSDFNKMVRIKPSVWTIHDPWPFTGHCVHPLDCTNWISGCDTCNNLDRLFSLEKDRSTDLWTYKKQMFSNLDIDIIVASKWMKQRVDESPITNGIKRKHIIPFGIDLEVFRLDPDKRKAKRKALNIGENDFVITFRSDPGLFKNLAFIKKMLAKLNTREKITLLTVGCSGLLEEEKKKYTVKELPWVYNQDEMSAIYSACDLFLMPSIAESFGMMAVEAMACSRPVIVTENTAVSDVTFSPYCGISIDKQDETKFASEVLRLQNSPEERAKRGSIGRKIAEVHYNEKHFLLKMIDLYSEIYERNYSTCKQ